MTDLAWTWLCVLGFAVAVGAYMARSRATTNKSVVPIIQRRRELQDELAGLVSPGVAAVLLREESARHKKAQWDIDVLTAAVRRAQAARARYDQLEANRKTLRAS